MLGFVPKPTLADDGRLISTTDPLGHVTSMFYNGVGNLSQVIDAQGKSTLFEYNHDNKVTRRTDAAGNFMTYEYNAEGKLLKQTDQEGKVQSYQYDIDGRLTKTIDGNGNEIALQYNDQFGAPCASCSSGALNQPDKLIFPTFSKEFTYDARGRKLSETDVAAGLVPALTTQFAYDVAGNLTQTTDKEGKITANTYDELGRLVRVTDPLGKTTKSIYDDRNNLIALEDAELHTTRFEYDKNGRLLREIRPMGQATTYAYNQAGLLAQKIDAKNQKIEYTYDDAGRLTATNYYATATDTTAAKTVSFTYTAAGKLEGYADGTTSAAYGYDDLYRNTTQTVNYGAFALNSAYTYYKNGKKQTFTGPDGISYSYTYDSNNQLAGITIPGQGTITYNSYTWNAPNSVTLPGGGKKEYSYDPLMRLKTITAKDPAQAVLLDYGYTFDKMSNITAKTTEAGNYSYNYDDLYRLTTVDNPVFSDESYTYDAVGNRLTADGASWTHNQNNQLTACDGKSFSYDANGNMTQQIIGGVTRNYIYDIENRLIRIEEDANVIAEYYYDPFGRRLYKDVGGTRTYFLYSQEGLIGEYTATGTQLRTYGWKPDSMWSTDPLFVKEGAEYYFYQNDHLGTPMKLVNASGAVVWSAKYQAFGKVNSSTGSVSQPFRFAGQYEDSESGLYYNFNRYYSPSLGRYLSEDPIGFEGGINLYGYGQNNSTSWIDPLGLKRKCVYIRMLVTAYTDRGPGSDWGHYKAGGPKVSGPPSSVGPGTIAVANSNDPNTNKPYSPAQPVYPYGATVTVYGESGEVDYEGEVHDTGRGWDSKHHDVSPYEWMDIWLPNNEEAKKWGKQYRVVEVCYDEKCPTEK